MKNFFNKIRYMALFIAAIILTGTALAQKPRTITGQVYDSDGKPMIGATVVVAGNNSVGTTTDTEGKYSIKATQDDLLTFSFLGYSEVSERVGTRTKINIIMKSENVSINDVVVIGYGTQQKKDLTGAVTSVNMDELVGGSIVSVDQALQGRMAGVEIITTSGEPGANASIRIRGSRSITASNEPLIVVDGVMDAVDSFSDIDPGDIKNVTVLKDASSTAIYGSRGANGVILVTTNGAQANKVNVTLRGTFGMSELPGRLDVMNASEFARYRNDVRYFNTYYDNGDLTNTYVPSNKLPYPNPEIYGKGTDWLDVMTRKAFSQNYFLSVSGGNKRSKVYFSLQYNDIDGIVHNVGQQYMAGRLKFDQDLFKWLKLGINANYYLRHNDHSKTGINGTSSESAIAINPLQDVYSDWNILGDNGTNGGSAYDNPYKKAMRITNFTDRTGLTLTPYIELNLAKGLKLKSTFTYGKTDSDKFYYSPSTMPLASRRKTGGTAYRQTYNTRNLLSETTLTYNRNFKKAHKLNVMAGFTAQNRNQLYQYTKGVGYLDDNVTFNNLGSLVDKRNLTEQSSVTEMQRLSVIGRANYSYRSRYHATLTMRYDGSSNFSKGNKWAFFPAAAFKWTISNEPFLNAGSWLTDLSLRVSAGRSGNDAVSSYVSQMALTNNSGGWLFGDTQEIAYYPTRLDNPNLTWEKTDSFNIGIDFAVLNNRIDVSLEAYKSYTRDLLLTVQNASQTGFTSRYANIGNTENTGVELSITSRNISRSKFQWTTNLTISHNQQMVTNIGNSYKYVSTYSRSGYMLYGYVKGYPANSLWGFQSAGTWHNKQEMDENKYKKTYVSYQNKLGYTKYVDVNHDGVLNDDDRVYLGSADPIIYGGLNNTFKILNNLSIGLFFTYSIGGKIYNLTEFSMGNGSTTTNQYRYMLNAWHPVRNPNSDIPAAYHYDSYGSDRYVYDASFLRLQNINISYCLDLRKKTRILRDITFSAACNNVFLISKYAGFDPDVSNGKGRIDTGWFPKNRQYSIAIQIRY